MATIGIDISQIVYEGTGVARYLDNLVTNLIRIDKVNSYVLFGSSLRQQGRIKAFFRKAQSINPRVKVSLFPFPPSILDLIWNRLQIIPIEWLIGKVDIFWSSDWTQPPLSGALGVTTIHDLSIFKYPESFDSNIRNVHRRKLNRSKQACKLFFCDSQATKKDVETVLNIPSAKLRVIYPGFN